MLLTWVGEPPKGKPFACHKDGNPLNNRVSNLYWGSHSDNMQDSLRHGTFVSGARAIATLSLLTEKERKMVRKRYEEGGITMRQLADAWGVSIALVWRCVHNKRQSRSGRR